MIRNILKSLVMVHSLRVIPLFSSEMLQRQYQVLKLNSQFFVRLVYITTLPFNYVINCIEVNFVISIIAVYLANKSSGIP